MKAFAFVLLCALVAVQARHTGVQKNTRAVAALGDAPHVVHLRVAVATSGLLNSCAGSLISNRWVLTAASCVEDSRFIWVRYGAVNVINPSLVTENSIVSTSDDNKVALISINRDIHSTDYIAPVALANSETEIAEYANFCAYGADDSGNPGEQLSCSVVAVDESLNVSSDEVETTSFDLGAPLVSDGVQVGLLVEPANDESIGTFLPVAEYLEWIEATTGVSFTQNVAPEIAPEVVKFVN